MLNTSKSIIMNIVQLSPVAYLISYVAALMVPDIQIYIAMILFVLIDLITGIWKSLISKVPITSIALRRTIEKILTYFMVILLARLFKSHILLDWEYTPIVKIVAGMILLAEFKSVTENMAIITGNPIFINIYKKVNEIFKFKSNEKNK